MSEQKKNSISQMVSSLPEEGFVRLRQIIGDKKRGIVGPVPVCRAAWYNGIKAGRYPAPVRIGERSTAWRVEDIRGLIKDLASEGVDL